MLSRQQFRSYDRIWCMGDYSGLEEGGGARLLEKDSNFAEGMGEPGLSIEGF